MVYAVAETEGNDEQFLAVFAFEGKSLEGDGPD